MRAFADRLKVVSSSKVTPSVESAPVESVSFWKTGSLSFSAIGLVSFPESMRKQTTPSRLFVDRPAPAVHTTSSCEPVAPEQPMAPMILPSSISGMPPREAITSSSVAM
jgi:hypothetical protein